MRIFIVKFINFLSKIILISRFILLCGLAVPTWIFNLSNVSAVINDVDDNDEKSSDTSVMFVFNEIEI